MVYETSDGMRPRNFLSAAPVGRSPRDRRIDWESRHLGGYGLKRREHRFPDVVSSRIFGLRAVVELWYHSYCSTGKEAIFNSYKEEKRWKNLSATPLGGSREPLVSFVLLLWLLRARRVRRLPTSTSIRF